MLAIRNKHVRKIGFVSGDIPKHVLNYVFRRYTKSVIGDFQILFRKHVEAF